MLNKTKNNILLTIATTFAACYLWTACSGPVGRQDKQLAEAQLIIDEQTLKEWSEPYRGWHYHPEHVILPKPVIIRVLILLNKQKMEHF